MVKTLLAGGTLKTVAKPQAEKLAADILPAEMFRIGQPHRGKYSTFDMKGIPLTLADGQELSKNQRKKIEKLYASQQKRWEKHQHNLKEAATSSTQLHSGNECTARPKSVVPPELNKPMLCKNIQTENAANHINTESLIKNSRENVICIQNVKIVAGIFGNRQGFQMESKGPFTHHFEF